MSHKPNLIPIYTSRVFISLLVLLAFSQCAKKGDTNTPDTDEIQVLMDKAAASSSSGNINKPILFLDSALEGKELTIRGRAKIYGFKADTYSTRIHDTTKALLYADSMLMLIEKYDPQKYRTEYALANYVKGDALFNQKKYNEAYTYYYKARLIGKTNLDSCTLGEYSYRLAMVLYRQARFTEAADNFKRTFYESGSCPFGFAGYYRMQEVLNNIGLCYYKAGNLDSATIYYIKGLQFIGSHEAEFPERKYQNDIAKGVFYGNLADIYTQSGALSDAKQLLKQSIEINTRKGYDNRDAQYSQLKLAEIYYKEGSLDSMHAFLDDTRRSLDTIGNFKAEMDWSRLMWHYYQSMNQIPLAYMQLSRYTTLRDSMESETNRLKSADLSQQIRMLENQYEIQALQKDNELKKVYLWIAVISSLLAVVIVFFIFRNLIRSKRNVELLQSLNTQVNEQKQQLQNALTALEEKNKQQDRILRAVAHDLRGPVATISMLCDLILQEQNAESRAEMVGFVQTSCNNSLELIAEILEAADQSKRKENDKESVSMNSLIKTSVELLRIKAAEKEQSIVMDLPRQDVFLMVNPEKIKRVINNLITNAIKFSDKGSEIKIRLNKEIEHAVITVDDNGIGIPENIQDKVFDMFTEAKRKGTAGELPYGLGLSICKQIVEAHSGTIWFKSKQDNGTRFFVKLPI